MAQQIIKENAMLKELVTALERQNNSRNQEKDVLLRQIDQLTEENDLLRDQLSKSNKSAQRSQQLQTLSRNKKQIEKNLSQVQNRLENTLRHQSFIESQNQKLRIQIQNLNNRLKTTQVTIQPRNNVQQIQKIKLENEQLRKKANLVQKIEKQASSLQKQNNKLKQNINQLKSNQTIRERQLQQRLSQFKASQSQQIRQIIKNQSDIRKRQQIQQITNSFEGTIRNKDQLIKELQNKLNAFHTKVYESQNSSSLQVRQLRASKADLQNKLNSLQNQRRGMEKKIKEYELEASHKDNLLSKKQVESAELENMKIMVFKKQQQLNRCEIVIDALNQNIALLQNMARQAQNQLQKYKLQQMDSDRRVQDLKKQQIMNIEEKYKNQINKLKQQLSNQQKIYPQMLDQQKRYASEKQRENAELKKILDQLNQNNKALLQKLKTIQQKQQTLPNVIPQSERGRSPHDNQLRSIVEQLRQQLRQVRSDFKRIQSENKKMENMIHQKPTETQPMKQQKNISIGNYNTKITNLIQNSNYKERQRKNINYTQQLSPKYSRQPPIMHAEQQSPKVKYTKLDKVAQKSRIVSGDGNLKSMHRDKWQMLQKRINQLRQQNQELKHSLYS